MKNLQTQTQAVMLLTTYLGKPQKGEARPLGPLEWNRFAKWLNQRQLRPEDLLLEKTETLLQEWQDPKISVERIQALLARSGALGLVMEKWERAGLWVLTRADVDYPIRLKKRLKDNSPPLFFGVGKRELLSSGGVAIIGSRHITDEDLNFTRQLAAEAAQQGHQVISGGARGVDEAAMLSALESNGSVVGVLGDSLLKAALSGKYRQGLIKGQLVLISPFNPEAGFDVGNAMNRNKYVYSLADAAVVIASDKAKGGTWSGAIENLNQAWVPLWVKPHSEPASGNTALIQREPGGRSLPTLPFEITSLFVPAESVPAKLEPPKIFTRQTFLELMDMPEPEEKGFYPSPTTILSIKEPALVVGTARAETGFYELFLERLSGLAANHPQTEEALANILELTKPQLKVWLKRAQSEGLISQGGKPVAYLWTPKSQQPSFLDVLQGQSELEQSA
jgi:predicted Rossmann fold nucleotide-binding protein DprA/Smf involved in DNA uptake